MHLYLITSLHTPLSAGSSWPPSPSVDKSASFVHLRPIPRVSLAYQPTCPQQTSCPLSLKALTGLTERWPWGEEIRRCICIGAWLLVGQEYVRVGRTNGIVDLRDLEGDVDRSSWVAFDLWCSVWLISRKSLPDKLEQDDGAEWLGSVCVCCIAERRRVRMLIPQAYMSFGRWCSPPHSSPSREPRVVLLYTGVLHYSATGAVPHLGELRWKGFPRAAICISLIKLLRASYYSRYRSWSCTWTMMRRTTMSAETIETGPVKGNTLFRHMRPEDDQIEWEGREKYLSCILYRTSSSPNCSKRDVQYFTEHLNTKSSLMLPELHMKPFFTAFRPFYPFPNTLCRTWPTAKPMSLLVQAVSHILHYLIPSSTSSSLSKPGSQGSRQTHMVSITVYDDSSCAWLEHLNVRRSSRIPARSMLAWAYCHVWHAYVVSG